MAGRRATIWWGDPTEWRNKEEMEGKDPLSPAETTGRIVSKGDVWEVTLTRYLGPDSSQDGVIQTIPKALVTKVEYLVPLKARKPKKSLDTAARRVHDGGAGEGYFREERDDV